MSIQLNGFYDKLFKVLQKNEIDAANKNAPYSLSKPLGAPSGWTFSHLQYDLNRGPDARVGATRSDDVLKLFTDILLQAKDAQGNYIVHDDDPNTGRGTAGNIQDTKVKALVGKVHKNTSASTLTQAELDLVNLALDSSQGHDLIDASIPYALEVRAEYAKDIIALAANQADKDFLSDDIGKLWLCDLKNQGQVLELKEFIKTGTALGYTKQGTFGVDDLLNVYLRQRAGVVGIGQDGVDKNGNPVTAKPWDPLRRFANIVNAAGGYTPTDLDEAKGVLRAYTYWYVRYENRFTSDDRLNGVNAFRFAVCEPADNLVLADVTSKYGITIQPRSGEYDDVLIGDDTANFSDTGDYQLNGRDGDDVLLGEGGIDVLDGGDGSDYLIGGLGNDTLKGGAGTDIYVFAANEGKDTIDDSDGSGQIVVGGQTLTGAAYQKFRLGTGSQVWESEDGKTTYTYREATKQLTITGDGLGADNSIVIDHFDVAQANTSNYLGLHLESKNLIELKADCGASPFGQQGHEPDANASTSLGEGLGKLFKGFLSAAAQAGDTFTLSLGGGSASKYAICKGDETVSFANGDITIELTEGQTEVSFSFLNTGDIDSAEALNLTATLNEAGSTDTAPSYSMQINVDATVEANAGPETTRTIVGGYPDGSDDLGNHISGTYDPNRNDRLYESAGNDLIQAGGGDDTVLAHVGGDDRIEGGAGNDALDGGVGKDWVLGESGRDMLFGGLGDDRVFGETEITVAQAILDGNQNPDGGQAGDWMFGNEGADILIGAANNDILEGGDGSDVLVGGAGNDIIEGDGDIRGFIVGQNASLTSSAVDDADGSMAGTITVAGQATRYVGSDPGADVVYGGNGNDFVLAGEGDDMVYGDAGADDLFGDAGNDVILGGAGNDNLSGDNGGSVLAYAAHGADFLDGGEGDDQLLGNGGSDALYGGAGDDTLIGDSADENAGDDYLDGEDGTDQLQGGAGADTLYGGLGDDLLIGDGPDVAADLQGDDTLDGEDGNDYLIGGGGADVLFGGTGDDQLFGEAADTPVEAQGDDYLDGEDGDDSLDGGGGSDTLIGGGGADQLFGDDADTAPEDMGDDALDGGEGDDILVGAGGNDTLSGGAGGDILLGDADEVAGDYHGADVLDGGDGDDTLYGGGGEDILMGGAGNDWLQGDGNVNMDWQDNDLLDGGEGDDTLFGEGGDDKLIGGAGDDSLWGGDGNDILAGGSGVDWLDGGEGDNIVDGGEGDDMLLGGDDNDTLDGGDGNDTLQAYGGEDTLQGGNGDDLYVVEANSGVKHISDSGGTDTLVIQGVSFSQVVLRLGSLMIDTGVPGGEIHLDDFNPDDPSNSGGIEFFQFDDGIYTYAELLAKGIEYNATPDDDVIDGTALSDAIAGLDGNDVIDGRAGNDLLAGDAGDDLLIGGDGNDRLDGGTGGDVMVGGAGHDTYIVDVPDDLVIEGADGGSDTVIADCELVLPDNVETLVLGYGVAAGTGNGGDNVIQGNAADNILDGGAGADTMFGWLGNDTYVVDNVGDVVVEAVANDYDTVISAVDYTLGDEVEALVLRGGSGATVATGNELDNYLAGNEGANVLQGMGGDDLMEGDAGDDTYYVDTAGDIVVEGVAEGTDTVIASVDYTLTDNVENLQLAESASSGQPAPFYGNGNALDNVIVGNSQDNELDGLDGNDTLLGGAGNDWLAGGAGADVLIGGEGSDTYWLDDGDDTVVEDDASVAGGADSVYAAASFTLSDNVEDLYLLGEDDLVGTGNALNNVVVGNDGDNMLYGMDGADTLDGGAGVDLMDGGAGDDTYYFDNVGDQADETLGSGHDTAYATATAALGDGIEDLVLDDAGGSINGTGNELDNLLVGNQFDNRLEGRAGNDTLISNGGGDLLVGGTGDDTYQVGSQWGGAIVEVANEGNDLVLSDRSFTLGANVEELRLLGDFADSPYMFNYSGNGNALDNRLWGSDADNMLIARDGNDVVDGRAGNDEINGGNGDDTLYGGGDAINVTFTQEGENGYWQYETWTTPILLATNADYIDGGAGDDAIDGGSGDDELLGGDGNDVLYGGSDGMAIASEGYAEGEFYLDRQNHSDYASEFYYGTGFLSNDDMLNGGVGDDTLDGGSGNDQLFGGDGNDVLIGGADGALNTNNDDYLDGGAGIDSMSGGTGNDTYVVDGEMEYLTVPPPPELCDIGSGEDALTPATRTLVADAVVENGDEGYDIVHSTVSYALPDNVEALYLDGAESIDATGNDGNNALYGNDGNNILDGRGGDDVMDGGAGDDTYVVDSYDDLVIEVDGNGTDTIRTSLGSYVLGDAIENLDLTGAAGFGFGNALDNRLRGNAVDNVLSGGDGNDVLAGGGGNDVLDGGDGDDNYVFVRGGGQDVIDDNSGVDRLILEDIEPADLTFAKNGEDLVIGVSGTTDSITLVGWVAYANSVESIAFCGGPVLDRAAIESTLLNQAPLATDDAGQVQEDGTQIAMGNLLATDVDPDGDVLTMATPAGVYAGNFGTLTLAADGGYSYALDNAAVAVQSLGVGQSVVDRFAYQVSDGALIDEGELAITIDGTNDVPVLAVPLPDQSAAVGATISWQVPAASFTDIDQGDALSYSATLADGSALPQWLAFDVATQTFSGQVPTTVTGSLDIQVMASDGHGALSVASDIFRVTFSGGGGGCGGDDEHDHHGDHDHHGGEHDHEGGCGGHDDSHAGHDGCGGSSGHSGHSGGNGNHDGHCGDEHDRDHSSKPKSDSWNYDDRDHGKNKGRGFDCLDVKQLDQHYEDNFGGKRQANTNAYVSQWIQVDLAVSRQRAEESSSLFQRDKHGADISTLNHAATGFLGSQYGFGPDALSLAAGAGTQLKSFKGLQEGMQRIGGR